MRKYSTRRSKALSTSDSNGASDDTPLATGVAIHLPQLMRPLRNQRRTVVIPLHGQHLDLILVEPVLLQKDRCMYDSVSMGVSHLQEEAARAISNWKYQELLVVMQEDHALDPGEIPGADIGTNVHASALDLHATRLLRQISIPFISGPSGNMFLDLAHNMVHSGRYDWSQLNAVRKVGCFYEIYRYVSGKCSVKNFTSYI